MLGSELMWFVLGMLFVLVAVGAVAWARDLGLKMVWWKWVLALGWYGLMNFTVAVPMTMWGENEPGAALRLFLLLAVVTVILGVGLWRVLWSGRKTSTT
jgi:hypothetical protein